MNRKRILIICGHPDPESYNSALTEAYRKGAENSGAEVEVIHIRDLTFKLNLAYGYRKRTNLEPDLLKAWESIKWAEHIVLIYPVWWGSIPAIMKGFFDRLFLPGMAFQKRENSNWWDKKLTGKTGRIICTLDQPGWFYRLYYGAPSHKAVKRLTMNFVGIRPVRITAFGPIRRSTLSYREKWLRKIEKLGKEQK